MNKNTLLHTKALVDKAVDEEGVVTVVASTEVIDRAGDSIDQSGWNLKAFKENPVILWGHNLRESRPPIGKALKVWVSNRGQKSAKLMAKIKFDLEDKFAESIWRKVKDGFINTVSVGFKPLEWEKLDEEDDSFWPGLKFVKSELLEVSFVPVPANPEAVVELRQLGIKAVEVKDLYENKEKLEALEFKKGKKKKDADEDTDVDNDDTGDSDADDPVSDDQDNDGDTSEPETTNEGNPEGDTDESLEDKSEEDKDEEEKDDTVEDEGEPIESEEEAQAEADKEEDKEYTDKGVIPHKDLGKAPESESWDGAGEIAKAEVDDLKLMCTWFDSEKSEVKGSYKLPHHKANGSHVAVWRGVVAAMASLMGARGGVDIPESDRKGVYNHLKKHYEEFGKEAPEFKHVEDQVLAGLDEEIMVLTLEREDRHVVRLIKRLTQLVKEIGNRTKEDEGGEDEPPEAPKDEEKRDDKRLVEALELLDKHLSKQLSVISKPNKGGEK